MIPAKGYRFVLKRGMNGHEIMALQINLHEIGYTLSTDGIFGPATEAAVKKFQTERGLTQDGIAGIMTQRSLALKLMAPYEAQLQLPKGILRGQVEGESGFAVGCVNWNTAGGVDCGWVQRRVYEGGYTDAAFAQAFNGKLQFSLVAKELREKKNEFYGKAGAKTHQRAWELAVLNHNWPVAAARMAAGKSIYLDPARDTQPADWVIAIGVPGVSTPRQWAEFYIARMTAYITTWTQ